MKKLFNVFLIGTFMFTFATKSFSQTEKTSSDGRNLTVEQKTTNFLTDMKTVITVTDDQVKTITPYVTELIKQKEADFAQNKGNNEALAKAKNARMTKFETELKTVLTDDQISKLKEHWANKNKPQSDKTK